MGDADLDALADRLAAAIAAGDHYPDWLVGHLDLDAALGVQVRLLRKALAAGAVLSGWKVGLTSDRARTALGSDARPFGYLLAETTFPTGAEIDTSQVRAPSIEAEFLFTIGSRLSGPSVGRDEVKAAVARVAAGYELNERRPGTARPDLPAMATDRMTQWGIVEGGGITPGDLDLDAVRVTMWCDDQERLSARSGDEVDDHYSSIARLVTELDRFGLALEPGQKVITGALGRFDLQAGERWRATFEGIGTVAIHTI
jgi:2-keto-4-pentenoate hydratase